MAVMVCSCREAHVIVDYETCMGCGVCVDRCAQDAISLAREEVKGFPLEICALMDAAA